MIRVLIADDSEIVRDILGRILADDEDIIVVGRARNGAEAVELARRLKPDLVLMGIDAPGGSNEFRYRVGFDINASGDASGGWSGVYAVPYSVYSPTSGGGRYHETLWYRISPPEQMVSNVCSSPSMNSSTLTSSTCRTRSSTRRRSSGPSTR